MNSGDGDDWDDDLDYDDDGDAFDDLDWDWMLDDSQEWVDSL